MPTELTLAAIEESTYVVTVTFTDEDGNTITPNSGLTYSLTDKDGAIVNSKENQALVEAASINIVLSGNDLVYTDDNYMRVLIVEGTYDSSLGTNLPLRDECRFDIRNLIAQ